jgi:hypothetical protein
MSSEHGVRLILQANILSVDIYTTQGELKWRCKKEAHTLATRILLDFSNLASLSYPVKLINILTNASFGDSGSLPSCSMLDV